MPEFDSLENHRLAIPDPDFGDDPGADEQTSIGQMSPDMLDGPYEICAIESELIHDAGKRQMCVAAATGDARIVTVKAPATRRVVNFHMKRVGIPPLVPAPVPATVIEVLLTANLQTRDVGLTENLETFVFEVRGRYVFALIDGEFLVPNEGVQMPTASWTLIPLADAILAVEQFKTGMF